MKYLLTILLFLSLPLSAMKHSPSGDNLCSLDDVKSHKTQFRSIMTELISFRITQDPYKHFAFRTVSQKLNAYCKIYFKTFSDLSLVVNDFSEVINELKLTSADISLLMKCSSFSIKEPEYFLYTEFLCHRYLAKKP